MGHGHETERREREVLREAQIVRELLWSIRHDLRWVIDKLIEIRSVVSPVAGSLHAKVAEVHGERRGVRVITYEVPKLLDIEKVLLSVMPRKADGTINPITVTWSVDNDQVGIQPGVEPFAYTVPETGETVMLPGAFNCWALTPLESGKGVVTCSAPGYESVEFPIEYAPGAPLSLNPSVGQPVSDL